MPRKKQEQPIQGQSQALMEQSLTKGSSSLDDQSDENLPTQGVSLNPPSEEDLDDIAKDDSNDNSNEREAMKRPNIVPTMDQRSGSPTSKGETKQSPPGPAIIKKQQPTSGDSNKKETMKRPNGVSITDQMSGSPTFKGETQVTQHPGPARTKKQQTISPEEKDDMDKEAASLLQDAINSVMSIPLSQVAPNFMKDKVTEAQAVKIVRAIAEDYQISFNYALNAVYLLFLKGAASVSAPESMTVEVLGRDISKRDLLSAYQFVTKNKYLRRLAEYLAIAIGNYAERNSVDGELANRLA